MLSDMHSYFPPQKNQIWDFFKAYFWKRAELKINLIIMWIPVNSTHYLALCVLPLCRLGIRMLILVHTSHRGDLLLSMSVEFL